MTHRRYNAYQHSVSTRLRPRRPTLDHLVDAYRAHQTTSDDHELIDRAQVLEDRAAAIEGAIWHTEIRWTGREAHLPYGKVLLAAVTEIDEDLADILASRHRDLDIAATPCDQPTQAARQTIDDHSADLRRRASDLRHEGTR